MTSIEGMALGEIIKTYDPHVTWFEIADDGAVILYTTFLVPNDGGDFEVVSMEYRLHGDLVGKRRN